MSVEWKTQIRIPLRTLNASLAQLVRALSLHHIDGDRHNNVFENLQILCPNCHAQTDNYGSKNKV